MHTHIAASVRAVADLTDPLARAIVDRSQPIHNQLIERIIRRTQLSWIGRRPSGGERNDLDLVSLMAELARRQALITLPGYTSLTPWKIRAGEQHIGTDRYGKLLRVTAHSRLLSFSATIEDESVVRTGKQGLEVGQERSYLFVDHNGVPYEGWRGLSWQLSSAESAFFTNRQLAPDGTFSWQYHLHPNRRQSLCGAPYLIAKLAHQRLTDEITHYTSKLRTLKSAGIQSVPDQAGRGSVVYQGPQRPELGTEFTLKLRGPALTGTYRAVRADEVGHRVLTQHLRELRQWRNHIQLVTRADEAAFYHFGREVDFTPRWIRGSTWQRHGADRALLELGEGLTLTWQLAEVPIAVAA